MPAHRLSARRLTVQDDAAATLADLARTHNVDEGLVVARGLALLEAAEKARVKGQRLAFVGADNNAILVDPWQDLPCQPSQAAARKSA